MEAMKTQERRYPVAGYVYIQALGRSVPLLDIPVMSDERERELGAQSAEKWKEANA